MKYILDSHCQNGKLLPRGKETEWIWIRNRLALVNPRPELSSLQSFPTSLYISEELFTNDTHDREWSTEEWDDLTIWIALAPQLNCAAVLRSLLGAFPLQMDLSVYLERFLKKNGLQEQKNPQKRFQIMKWKMWW